MASHKKKIIPDRRNNNYSGSLVTMRTDVTIWIK